MRNIGAITTELDFPILPGARTYNGDTLLLDLDQTLIAGEEGGYRLFPGVCAFLAEQINHDRNLVIVTHGNEAHVDKVCEINPQLRVLVDIILCREKTSTVEYPKWLAGRKEGQSKSHHNHSFLQQNYYGKDLRTLLEHLQLETFEKVRMLFVGNVPDLVAAESAGGLIPLFCVDQEGAWLKHRNVEEMINKLFAREEHPANVCWHAFEDAKNNQKLQRFESRIYLADTNPVESGTVPGKLIMASEFAINLNAALPLISYNSFKGTTYVFRATPELEHGVYFQQP